MDKTQPHPLFKLATELGPLLVFFVANAKFNLFVATGAFMVAIVAAMIASYMVVRHVPIMAIVTAVIVLVFAIPDDVLVRRISERTVCESCQTPYTGHMPGSACPKCGGRLVRRADDEPEAEADGDEIRIEGEQYAAG